MKIKVGMILNPKTIDDVTWEVMAVIGEAVCIQSSEEEMDAFGHINSLSWFKKSELENSKNIEVL